MTSSPESGPPPAPDIPRSIRFTTLQRVGIPILFGIPILALFGVLGEHYRTARASGENVSVRFEYPDRIHYRQQLSMNLEVRNNSPYLVDTLMVSLDPSFMRAFTATEFSPPVITAFSVPLIHVGPGETRVIAAEISGDDYGSHAGWLRVRSPTGELKMPISTFVFP